MFYAFYWHFQFSKKKIRAAGHTFAPRGVIFGLR